MSLRKSMTAFVGSLAVVIPVAATAGGGGGADIERDTVGVVRGIGGSGAGAPAEWILRSSNDPLCATPAIARFGFGDDGDQVLSADLAGDGLSTATVFRDINGAGFFFVRDSNATGGSVGTTSIPFGAGTDVGIVGNFDPSDPGDEVGVYRPSTRQFFLRTDSGITQFAFGDSGDVPIVGNWDNSVDGSEEVGLYRPSTSQFFMRADNMPGSASVMSRSMGASGDDPLAGDWDGDGMATIGVRRDLTFGIFFLSNQASGGTADISLPFGAANTDRPVVGDWDGPTVDQDGCGV
mgnify:CR=1 FL=1